MNIYLDDVSFSYGNIRRNTDALNHVSLEIGNNEIISVIGKTGAGKSTLCKIIKGLAVPQYGNIYVDGKKYMYKKKGNNVIKNIGYIFQYPDHQIFETTVLEDISFGLSRMNYDKSQIVRMVSNALEKVGLNEEYLSKSIFELSGGEKRRVALAGVLVMNPKMLIMDEPTVGLDPKGKRLLFEIILEWMKKEKGTVMFVTHNMREVIEYSNRVIVMSEGRIIIDSKPYDLFMNYTKQLEEFQILIPDYIRLLKILKDKGIQFDVYDEKINQQAILSIIERKINNEYK